MGNNCCYLTVGQEDALAELIKKGSGTGFALASMLSKGSKFGGIDIKRVYFGYESNLLSLPNSDANTPV